MLEPVRFDSQAFEEFASNHHIFHKEEIERSEVFERESLLVKCEGKKKWKTPNRCSQPLFIISFSGVEGCMGKNQFHNTAGNMVAETREQEALSLLLHVHSSVPRK